MRCSTPAVAILLLAGCGYVGEPLPPALNIPARIADLRAVERGDKVIVEFTLPDSTTEGLPLKKLGSIELRAGDRLLDAPFDQSGPARVETAVGDWIGQQIVFRVRVANARGRWSEWSNQVALDVVPALQSPVSLEARSEAEGVRIRWRDPQPVAFRVYRKAEKEKQPAVVARVETREWLDKETEYGKRYEYWVQAALKAGAKEAESEIAGPTAITPVDLFPPATPAGLTAIAGIASIELVWNRNTEPDLRGYRLYRATASGALERIEELIETPSYSDRRIESGATYRYAVSAVDQLGNESQPCAPVQIAAP